MTPVDSRNIHMQQATQWFHASGQTELQLPCEQPHQIGPSMHIDRRWKQAMTGTQYPAKADKHSKDQQQIMCQEIIFEHEHAPAGRLAQYARCSLMP